MTLCLFVDVGECQCWETGEGNWKSRVPGRMLYWRQCGTTLFEGRG